MVKDVIAAVEDVDAKEGILIYKSLVSREKSRNLRHSEAREI